MTDDVSRDREQSPGAGRVYDEPTHPFGAPASGPPASGPPVSASPYGQPYGADQYGLDAAPVSAGGYAAPPFNQRRIEPSPPPRRSRLILGLVIGLVLGAVSAGGGMFFVGRATAPQRPAQPPVAQPPAAVAELQAANRAAFTGDLAALAEPWLTDMSGCVADTDSGGPQLGKGQRAHVLCRDGGMYLHFVSYASPEAKAADQDFRQQISLSSAAFLPGAEQAGRKLGGVTGAPGRYVEYATRTGRNAPLCGFWWNRDNADAAVYLDVLCDSLGGTWDPLRAVWQRHS